MIKLKKSGDDIDEKYKFVSDIERDIEHANLFDYLFTCFP